MNSDQGANAAFKPVGVLTLSVTAPAGTSISGMGLTCGPGPKTCNIPVTLGAQVALKRSSAPGYVFRAWTDDCAGQGDTCNLVANKVLKAGITAENVGMVAVAVDSSGPGGVVACEEGQPGCATLSSPTVMRVERAFTKGAHVTLRAQPAGNAKSVTWGGDCTGTSTTCAVTLGAKTAATVQFR